MKIVSWSMGFLGAGVMFAAACALRAQSGAAVPLPDPGYGLYYHDVQGAANVANRWGYHDGWTDGRHDRNHGDAYRAQENDQDPAGADYGNPHPPDYGDAYRAQERDHYLTPPDHGPRYGMMHDQYVKAYRIAYIHGYEHGSRL